MANFALTEKLRKVIKPESLVDLSQSLKAETWFCNYFIWKRKKWLLMINIKTLITVFREEVSAAEIRGVHGILNEELIKTSEILNLDLSKLRSNSFNEVYFGKTFDKRTLGILNEQVKGIKAFLTAQEIKKDSYDRSKIIWFLNNMIFRNKDDSHYSSPVQLFQKSQKTLP